jgi:hypothetical protein
MQDPGREPVRSASASPPLEYPGDCQEASRRLWIRKTVAFPTSVAKNELGFSDLVVRLLTSDKSPTHSPNSGDTTLSRFLSSGADYGLSGMYGLQDRVVAKRNRLLTAILCPQSATQFTTICPRFARKNRLREICKCQYKQKAIATQPKIHHKQPQLTTNPEDHFFPQQTGPANALDFGVARKAPSRAVHPPHLS